MYPQSSLACGLIGILAATALRRPMFTMAVAAGQPDRSRCPGCGQAPMGVLPSWRGRCLHCAIRIGPPPGSVELLSGLLCAGVALGFGNSFQTLGFAAVAVIGVALAVVDLASFRLPDRLIGLAGAILLLCLLAAAGTEGRWARLEAGALGAAGLGAAYLLLAVLRPGQLGLGDVKLAVLLGLLLGWFGWPFVVLGGCLAFLLSALTILLLMALRRITLRSTIPFGPFMLAGALAALLL